jgi:excisionase family DNA binding protein
MSPLLDLKEAARLLSISPWTVRAYVKAGKLNPVRIGRRVLLEEAELQRFITESKGDPDRSGEKK